MLDQTILSPAFAQPKTSFRPRMAVSQFHDDPAVLWPEAPGRRAWTMGPDGRLAARWVG